MLYMKVVVVSGRLLKRRDKVLTHQDLGNAFVEGDKPELQNYSLASYSQLQPVHYKTWHASLACPHCMTSFCDTSFCVDELNDYYNVIIVTPGDAVPPDSAHSLESTETGNQCRIGQRECVI